MIAKAIGGLTALVLLAAPAQAFPNEKPSTEGVLWNAVQIADQFWAKAGYPEPCAPQILTYDDPTDTALARAWIGGCHVWINGPFLKAFKNVVNHPQWYSWLQRRAQYRLLCKVMIHERGHNLGFSHAHDGSIMEPNPDDQGTPGVCVDWSIRSVRRS